ncbi:cytochrome c oxidase assembly protein [Rhodococcus ruber]|uniref:cytochrome c oxidase assembly protein n=1 Tax=Rhodococcus ruber TaxID=1830 RepID=UPI00065FF77C|nr:cytochrome c oxidase assembly protein [Rhodococcus ruber]MDO1480270.1 cytochrome c oxidase assembly protein [Rhodococcus ruber]
MHDHSMLAPGSPGLLHLLVVVVAAAIAGTYLAASSRLRRRGDVWSRARDASFVAGCAIVAAATVPLPVPAFTGHMGVHLGVGMVGPVLLVLARPVTLALRAVQPGPARRALVSVAHSGPVAVLTAPPVAAVLDLGGLWLLYRTGLFAVMHHSLLLGAVVHLHVFAAGVLFAYAICQVDPVRHRYGLGSRAAVLFLAGTAHAILAESLYASPPPGHEVATSDLQAGALVMYYGGDLVEVALAVVPAVEWYRRTGRDRARSVRRDAAEGPHAPPRTGVGATPRGHRSADTPGR